MFNQPEILYIWVSVFLLICAGLDFYSARIPNTFILVSFVMSLILVCLFLPFHFWLQSVLSFLILFFLGFILFRFKILGGGDIKALCIVALFLRPSQLQDFLSYSLLWSGTYAVIFYILTGQILMVLWNTFGVFKKITKANHKIPFTFGILLGWLSLFTMGVLSW